MRLGSEKCHFIAVTEGVSVTGGFWLWTSQSHREIITRLSTEMC